jgi:hypothetical protein
MKEHALFAGALQMPPHEMAGWPRRAFERTRAMPTRTAKAPPKRRPRA